MNIKEMVGLPEKVVGMASMLLIELAMFRNDILSYRPDTRKSFIGEEIGATHHVGSKVQLKEYLHDPPMSSSMQFRNKFKNSGVKIPIRVKNTDITGS